MASFWADVAKKYAANMVATTLAGATWIVFGAFAFNPGYILGWDVVLPMIADPTWGAVLWLIGFAGALIGGFFVPSLYRAIRRHFGLVLLSDAAAEAINGLHGSRLAQNYESAIDSQVKDDKRNRDDEITNLYMRALYDDESHCIFGARVPGTVIHPIGSDVRKLYRIAGTENEAALTGEVAPQYRGLAIRHSDLRKFIARHRKNRAVKTK